MEVIVVRPGIQTTVQDAGRRFHRSEGVPMGGGVDPFALRLANLLVGNPEDAAVLETTLVGPELEFTQDTLIAVTGATFDSVPGWRPLMMSAGQRLVLGAPVRGCRGYIAIAGGFDVPVVLGGRGTHLRGGFGGLKGRALREGDRLPAGERRRAVVGHWSIDLRILPAYSSSPVIRVLKGAHGDAFGSPLYQGDFKVSPQSDRMGIRLNGTALKGEVGQLISTGIAPGTIQVPPNGSPISLLADAQTVGGYPRVAHAVSVDLPLLAQLRPGDSVRFEEVSLDDAHVLALGREHAIALLREGLADKFR